MSVAQVKIQALTRRVERIERLLEDWGKLDVGQVYAINVPVDDEPKIWLVDRFSGPRVVLRAHEGPAQTRKLTPAQLLQEFTRVETA